MLATEVFDDSRGTLPSTSSDLRPPARGVLVLAACVTVLGREPEIGCATAAPPKGDAFRVDARVGRHSASQAQRGQGRGRDLPQRGSYSDGAARLGSVRPRAHRCVASRFTVNALFFDPARPGRGFVAARPTYAPPSARGGSRRRLHGGCARLLRAVLSPARLGFRDAPVTGRRCRSRRRADHDDRERFADEYGDARGPSPRRALELLEGRGSSGVLRKSRRARRRAVSGPPSEGYGGSRVEHARADA